MTPRHGSLIGGRYSLEQSIGSGGMGEVFRARDTLLGRSVAVKLVHAAEPRKQKQVADSFLREARISAAIAHPNVVQILDFGIHEADLPFIVMELLEGENLADALGRGVSMPAQVVFDLVARVLDALRAAHAAGVVHRDLKPENIFLTQERGGVSPKLLDFGISKVLDKTGVARVTTTHGHIVGTPAYMSPEQARGLKEIDQRTDVYSMGVVMYELLSGELPFFSENPGDLLVMIMTGQPLALSERVPELAGPFSELVAKAMAKEPEARYRDAGEMYEALRNAQRSQPQLTSAPVPRKRPKDAPLAFESLTLAPPPEHLTIPGAVQDSAAPSVRRLVFYGLVVSLSLATGALALRGFGTRSTPEPRFIVVQTDAPQNEGAPPHSPTSSLPRARAESLSSPRLDAAVETTLHKRSAPASDAADSLAQSFRAQRAGVVRCVNTYPSEVERSPKLTLRLALDPRGQVSEAQLSPAELAHTPLSRCIESAARVLKFPKQASGIVFDIPLTARKGG